MLIQWVKRQQYATRLAQDDAAALMFEKGAAAHAEAERRERASLLTRGDASDQRRGRTHWRRVAGIIAKHAAH